MFKKQSYKLCLPAVCLVILCLSGCGDNSGLNNNNVIYDGQAYGAFRILYDAVYLCIGAGEPLPNIPDPNLIIVQHPFNCSGVEASGCYNGPITVVGPAYAQSGTYNNLMDTQGALWSFEVVHYILHYVGDPLWQWDGSGDEPWQYSKCGSIHLPNFMY